MAMALKSNGFLKILVPAVLVIVLLVVVMASSGDNDAGRSHQLSDTTLELKPEELKLLGVEGDTPQDTVATLVGRVRMMEQDLEGTRSESQQLADQNRKLTEQNRHVDRKLETLMQQERRRMDDAQRIREQSLLSRFEQQFDQLKNNYSREAGTGEHGRMPIGSGWDDTGQGSASPVVWVKPMDGEQAQTGRNQGKWSFPSSFADEAGLLADSVSRGASSLESRATGQPDAALLEPVYTVPANATLMGSLGMTALIGRVPVNGTVSDPYPFKVIIGKDNLTANHIEIPEVHSAIVSGTATGDWTLSCVRGAITSMTFVFKDGTVRTIPQPATGNLSRTRSSDDVLGYISDPYGIPCVSGIRRSNAKEYLGSRALITAAGAAVASSLIDESTGVATINTDGSVSTAITGNQAAASVLTNGISDISDWVNRLYGEAFAAVYVQPGVQVAVHIEQPLEIDYDQAGRKVRHQTPAGVFNELP